MGGMGGGQFKTRGGGNHSSGGMGYLQGWDFVDCHHENEGVTASPGKWGCFLQGWDLVVRRHQ